MSIKGLIGSTVELILKAAALVFAVSYILKGSTAAYEYGYRIFTEAPISVGEGRIISVSVEEDMSTRDVGLMLAQRGLIRDANLFVIQELLSENHGKIKPGIYDLSTSMTAQEMMAKMAASASEEEEESAPSAKEAETSAEGSVEALPESGFDLPQEDAAEASQEAEP